MLVRVSLLSPLQIRTRIKWLKIQRAMTKPPFPWWAVNSPPPNVQEGNNDEREKDFGKEIERKKENYE